MLSIVATAEGRFGISLKKKMRDEYCGPCPKCGGTDRFLVFADKGFWCRQCLFKGWVDDDQRISQEEIRLRKIEVRQRELERKQQEQQARMTALERMAKCSDHLRYHDRINQQVLDYWFEEGIVKQTVDKYLLGFCGRCPTDKERRPSYTIPIINGGVLRNIRHRLIGANGDKYRPHAKGLGTQLFNSDKLKNNGSILIVEGEKKSIVLDQFGFDSVAICGKRQFRQDWLPRFAGKDVTVVLDPDALDSAYRLAAMFQNGKVASLPCKIDDMLAKYYASADDLRTFLNLARPV